MSSKPRTLHELLQAARLRASDEQRPARVPVSLITDDSRKVREGACFVAIRGAARDGHAFVESAIRAGASVVLVERAVEVPSGVAQIVVDDTRVALARLAAAWFGLTGGGLRLVGVTGTNGKTTVAWLLRSILRGAGCRTALLGTVEYDLIGERRTAPLTTPGSLELSEHLSTARAHGATDAVMEVSSHALDQRRCDGLHFDVGVFTNMTGDHLDYHKSMDAYAAAKRRLFESLDPQAVAVINRDDPRSGEMIRATSARVATFGLDSPDVHLTATITRMDRQGTDLILRWCGEEVAVQTTMIGRHNVSNVLAAASAARSMGVDPQTIRCGLEKAGGAPGRLQRSEPPGWPYSVFVDYAHTDDALRNVLHALRPLTRGRLRCVFGCGGDRDRTKRPRMAAVAAEMADVVYVTSDNPRTEDPREIIEEILRGFAERDPALVQVQPDRRAAIEQALAEAQEGDTVLIAGKGHENYQIIGREVFPFDDVEVVKAWCESARRVREVA